MGKKSVLIILSLLCLMTSFPSALADEYPQIPKIEVVGRARIMVMPNIGILSFAVESSAKTAQEAVKQNAEKAEKILQAIKKTMGKEDKIRTSSYNLSPVYEKGERLRPEGYRVRNMVILETKNLEKVGTFIDEGVKSGAGGIGNLTFRTDREEEVRKEAAIQAARQAMANAKELAKAAGLTIKRIIKVSYGPRDPVFKYPAEANVLAAAQTPIAIGEIAIEASVIVTFEVN